MKSNRSKYENLGYTLRGKPGKRRWHKREQFSDVKKFDAVLGAVNSATAAANRNQREIALIKKARNSDIVDKEERYRARRRAVIRFGTFAMFAGSAVALSTAAIFAGHTKANQQAATQVSQEIIKSLAKRNKIVTQLVEIGRDQAVRSGSGMSAPGILEIIAKRSRGQQVDFPISKSSMIDAGLSDMKMHEENIRKGAQFLVDSLDHRRISDDTREKFQQLLKVVSDTSIFAPLREINEAPGSRRWAEKARDILNQSTNYDMNVSRIDPNPSDPDYVYKKYDEIYRKMVDKSRRESPGGFMTTDVNGEFLDRRAEQLITPEEINRAAKTFVQDFMEGVNRRRDAFSKAIRAGDPDDSGMQKYGETLGRRPLLKGLNNKQKRKRIIDAVKAAASSRSNSGNQSSDRTRQTALDALGKGLVAYHVGAGIGYAFGENANRSLEADDKKQDERRREIVIASRIDAARDAIRAEKKSRMKKDNVQSKSRIRKPDGKAANNQVRREMKGMLSGRAK